MTGIAEFIVTVEYTLLMWCWYCSFNLFFLKKGKESSQIFKEKVLFKPPFFLYWIDAYPWLCLSRKFTFFSLNLSSIMFSVCLRSLTWWQILGNGCILSTESDGHQRFSLCLTLLKTFVVTNLGNNSKVSPISAAGAFNDFKVVTGIFVTRSLLFFFLEMRSDSYSQIYLCTSSIFHQLIVLCLVIIIMQLTLT